MKRLNSATYMIFAMAVLAFIMATTNFVHGQTAVNEAATDLLSKLNNLALPDVQNAEAIAKASGDEVADQCYVAIISVMQKVQASTSALPAATQKISVVTDFQKVRGAVNALRPTSDLFIKCAALKAEVGQDIKLLPAQGVSSLLGILN